MERPNYAAAECGARIVDASRGTRGAAALLQPHNRDGYMATACAVPTPHHATVELCADVRVDGLALGSHEPFASGPRGVRLWGRSAARREWLELGAWVLPPGRRLHVLPVAPCDAYVRAVRVELLDYHGREHFCVLSEVRVHGKTMLDDFEDDGASAAGSAALSRYTAAGDANVFRRIHERVARLERAHAASMAALQRAFRAGSSAAAIAAPPAPTPPADSPGGVPWLWLAVGAQALAVLVLALVVLKRPRTEPRADAGPERPASALPSPVDASAPLLDDGATPAVFDAAYVSAPSSPREKSD